MSEYKIKTISDHVVESHPYKSAQSMIGIISKVVDQLLVDGEIDPSLSKFATPGFLVPKPIAELG